MIKVWIMMYLILLGLAGWMVWQAWSWPFDARIGPLSVGIFVLSVGAISFAAALASRARPNTGQGGAGQGEAGHMDTPLAANGLTGGMTARRAALFGAYLMGFLGAIAVIGMIPTVAVFTVVYMRLEGCESWRKIAIEAAMGVARVDADRKPVCWLTAFGDSSLDFVLRFWIHDPQQGLTNVRGKVLLALWDTFKEHGVKIPYPHREVIMRKEAGD